MSLRSVNRRCSLIRPPGCKLQPLSYPPPPNFLTKIHSQNEDATPPPGHLSPRPRLRSLIVVSLRSANGRCSLIHPPGGKLRPLSYPPLPKNSTKIHSQNEDATPSPKPFQPPPPRALVDCGVVEVGKWAVWSNSPARSQIATSFLPPPPPKNLTKIPFLKRCCHAIPRPFQPLSPRTLINCGVLRWHRLVRSYLPARSQIATSIQPPPRRKINPKSSSKNEGSTQSPGRFSPNPVVLRLIVMFSAIVTGRLVRFRPPGRKMKAIPQPPPQTNIANFSS